MMEDQQQQVKKRRAEGHDAAEATAGPTGALQESVRRSSSSVYGIKCSRCTQVTDYDEEAYKHFDEFAPGCPRREQDKEAKSSDGTWYCNYVTTEGKNRYPFKRCKQQTSSLVMFQTAEAANRTVKDVMRDLLHNHLFDQVVPEGTAAADMHRLKDSPWQGGLRVIPEEDAEAMLKDWAAVAAADELQSVLVDGCVQLSATRYYEIEIKEWGYQPVHTMVSSKKQIVEPVPCIQE